MVQGSAALRRLKLENVFEVSKVWKQESVSRFWLLISPPVDIFSLDRFVLRDARVNERGRILRAKTKQRRLLALRNSRLFLKVSRFGAL